MPKDNASSAREAAMKAAAAREQAKASAAAATSSSDKNTHESKSNASTSPLDDSAAPPKPKPRAPPPPPDPHYNSVKDKKALIPILITTFITLYTLYLCAPSHEQWNPPVDAHQLLLSFEWPGRNIHGGAFGI